MPITLRILLELLSPRSWSVAGLSECKLLSWHGNRRRICFAIALFKREKVEGTDGRGRRICSPLTDGGAASGKQGRREHIHTWIEHASLQLCTRMRREWLKRQDCSISGWHFCTLKNLAHISSITYAVSVTVFAPQTSLRLGHLCHKCPRWFCLPWWPLSPHYSYANLVISYWNLKLFLVESIRRIGTEMSKTL